MISTVPSPVAAPGQRLTFSVMYEGVEREVAVFVPSAYAAGTPTPLVFALHGGSGDASVMYAPDKRIVAHAESDGFIAVFPNGLPKPDKPNSHNYFWEDPVNIGYMAFLMEEMTNRYSIDAERIYFVGFSGGAKLIYGLAADPHISAQIAAIGTVAGDIGGRSLEPAGSPWDVLDPSLSGGVAVPAFLVQGGRDDHLPALGGFDNENEKIVVGFETKVAIWRQFTGAHAEAAYPNSLPASVTARRWLNRAGGSAVVAVVDGNLAHHWPVDWDAMGEFWQFFQHVAAR